MTIKLDNLKLNVGENESELFKRAKKRMPDLKTFRIVKKSLDARNKAELKWVYSVEFSNEHTGLMPAPEKIKNPPEVAVIGSGPAGLFCAVRLIEHGFKPVIIERGKDVDARKAATQKFFKEKILDENSNVQFGEGGAGTFSDGKLNTQTHDGLNKDVLEIFHKFGAPEEILYLNKPHVGSDRLCNVLKNIRKYITDNGGKYVFDTVFCGLNKSEGKLKSIVLKNVKTERKYEIKVENVVLAVGHSARDTFEMLFENGVLMEPREFALGVRIEHLAEKISYSQYGKDYIKLPPADYKLVSHAHERTVFTFCMCPGGVVIPSASERGGVVTNGMSLYARDGKNSNSALMVQLKKQDFGGGLFSGMEFQRKIERLAYDACGNDYSAPVQLLGDFLKGRASDGFKSVQPTYSAGVKFCPLDTVLPNIVCEALKTAVPDMDRRLKGFGDEDAVLTGVETRFSSPVRILRSETFESVTLKGLYPCGEGSGYSGGITSSAADGLRIAETLFNKYKNH